jgi:ABC-2 type transport system permease protein
MRFDLGDVYTIWLREFKRWTRSKSRIIASMAQPILWLVLFGTAFDAMFAAGPPGSGGGGLPGADELDFKSFFTPGIVAMTVLFGSIFAGIGLIFDREFGFLKEIMVAPVSRTSIMAGKGLGGATGAVISGLVIMVLAVIIGAQYTPDIPLTVAAVTAVVTVLMISLAFVNMGIAFATRIHNFEGFQMVMNFLVMPMFFLSGAFYPVQSMPDWLQGATYVNPLFYGVDALRHCFNGSAAAALPLGLDLAILLMFTVATTAVGVVLFRKME